MSEKYAYQITRKVLEEVYPEQLIIFDEWQRLHARAESRGESGSGHSIVQSIPDFIFAIIVLAQLQNISSGLLSGVIANMITDRFGPKPPPWTPDEATIKKLAETIAAEMKAQPPEGADLHRDLSGDTLGRPKG